MTSPRVVPPTRKALNALERMYRAEPEKTWQTWVIDEAHRLGWWVVHFRPARTEHGWRTPVQADAAGWVDLALYRDRMIHAELKTETGQLTPAECDWRDRIIAANGEWYLWRPSHRAEITRILT